MAEPLASAMARKTAMLAPKITCVSVMLDSLRRTQGRVMTGCRTSSDSSPRCAASCCTHHWQIFLNVRGGSCRPHRMQFAMLIIKIISSGLSCEKGRRLKAGTTKGTKEHEGKFWIASCNFVSFVVEDFQWIVFVLRDM